MTIGEHILLDIPVAGLLARLAKGQPQVSILIRDTQGRWVLGQKPDFYPAGIVRMLGGGVDPGEDMRQAARRELAEETGVDVPRDALTHIVDITVTARTPDGRIGQALFAVYFLDYQGHMQANDDIKGFAYLTDEDMASLISAFSNLPDTPLATGSDALWSDYGRMWSAIHLEAWQRAKIMANEQVATA